MKKSQKLVIIGALLAILLIMAAGAQPQLSLDEQNAIVEAVVQTMNPENMKATIIAEVEADLIAKLNAGGYVGVAGALAQPLPQAQATPVPVQPALTEIPALPEITEAPAEITE